MVGLLTGGASELLSFRDTTDCLEQNRRAVVRIARAVSWLFIPGSPMKWARRAVGSRRRYVLMCCMCLLFAVIIMSGIRVVMDVVVLRHQLQLQYGDHRLFAQVEWGTYLVLCLCFFATV